MDIFRKDREGTDLSRLDDAVDVTDDRPVVARRPAPMSMLERLESLQRTVTELAGRMDALDAGPGDLSQVLARLDRLELALAHLSEQLVGSAGVVGPGGASDDPALGPADHR